MSVLWRKSVFRDFTWGDAQRLSAVPLNYMNYDHLIVVNISKHGPFPQPTCKQVVFIDSSPISVLSWACKCCPQLLISEFVWLQLSARQPRWVHQELYVETDTWTSVRPWTEPKLYYLGLPLLPGVQTYGGKTRTNPQSDFNRMSEKKTQLKVKKGRK